MRVDGYSICICIDIDIVQAAYKEGPPMHSGWGEIERWR